MANYVGTIPAIPLYRDTSGSSPVHRRVVKVLRQMECTMADLSLTEHEARLLIDMGTYQAAVESFEELKLTQYTALKYFTHLMGRNLYYAYEMRDSTQLASLSSLERFRDSIQYLYRQLLLIDLCANHEWELRISRVHKVLEELRNTDANEWDEESIRFARYAIVSAISLTDDTITTATAAATAAALCEQVINDPDVLITDAQPQQAVTLSSVESNGTKSTKYVGDTDEQDQEHTQEDDTTSRTIQIEQPQELHELQATSSQQQQQQEQEQPSPILARALPSRVQIEATQSSEINSSLVDSSPSIPSAESDNFLEEFMARLPSKEMKDELSTFINALTSTNDQTDIPFQNALNEAYQVIEFLKTNLSTLKSIAEEKDTIVSLNTKLHQHNENVEFDHKVLMDRLDQLQDSYDRTLDTPEEPHSISGNEAQLPRRDLKLLFEYMDRRVNSLQNKTSIIDDRVAVLTSVEENFYELRHDTFELRDHLDKTFEKKLEKHVQTLQRFSNDLKKIADVTIAVRDDSKLHKTALNKKLDSAMAMTIKSQRELSLMSEQLDLKPIKKRLTNLEEKIDDIAFGMTSSGKADANASTSSKELDDLKTKVSQLSNENQSLTNKHESIALREQQISTKLKDQLDVNRLLTEQMKQMAKSQDALLKRFSHMEKALSQLQNSQGSYRSNSTHSTNGSFPLAQSTQIEQIQGTTPSVQKRILSPGKKTPIIIETVELNSSDPELEEVGVAAPTTPLNGSIQTQHHAESQPAGTITIHPRSLYPSIGPLSGANTLSQRDSPLLRAAPAKAPSARQAKTIEYQKTLQASMNIKNLLDKNTGTVSRSASASPGESMKRPSSIFTDFKIDLKKLKLTKNKE